jgi:hypothetical protein
MTPEERRALTRYLIECVGHYVKTMQPKAIVPDDIFIVTGLLSHVLTQAYLETAKNERRTVQN